MQSSVKEEKDLAKYTEDMIFFYMNPNLITEDV